MATITYLHTALSNTLLPNVTSLAARRLLIAAISVFDAALVIVFSDCIVFHEENPVGQALISVGNGNVAFFVLTKLFGTAVVYFVLRELHRRDFAAVPVTNALLAFQTWLVWYLCVSDWQTTGGDMMLAALLVAGLFSWPSLKRLSGRLTSCNNPPEMAWATAGLPTQVQPQSASICKS